MTQIYKSATGILPPGEAVQTLSAEGGPKTPPDASNNFDFMGGAQDAGSSPFLITNTVSFGITANGFMKANAVFPHWQVINSNQSAFRSQGYLVNNGGSPVTLTLPVMPLVGDSFTAFDLGGGTFIIAQNNGDSIRLGSNLTTTGVAGNLTSTQRGNTVTLVCWAAGPGASWVVVSLEGSILVN